MAPSELAEIRALLIAQTEPMEPRRPARLLAVVDALLKPRGEAAAPLRPLSLSTLPPPTRPPARQAVSAKNEGLLLLGEEIDPDVFEPLDLPPPPRAEFGVRSPRPYLPHDSVLLLNNRLPAQPQRLTLLTDAGEAVGEIYLTPEDAQARPIYNAANLDDDHQAPYFPGDLEEADALTLPVPTPSETLTKTGPNPSPSSPRSLRKTRSASAPARPGLGHDLLHALALTLAREHEALCDRLLVCTR